MGDVIGKLVGGAMQARAGRRAGQDITRATEAGVSELVPTQEAGREATNFISALLGTGGDPGEAQEALRRFREATGFQDQLQQGTQAITGSAAARGLLDSGSTARGLQRTGQQMAQQSLNNFLAQLGVLSGQGVNASSNIANIRTGGGTNAAQARLGGRMAQGEAAGNALSALDLSQLIPGG